jgi:exopolysaccharide production protein ExoQ
MSFIEPTVASIIGLSPPIALLATVAFIFFLFRRDIREQPNVTGALWLPLIWMVLIGSRSPTQWLTVGGYMQGGSMEEGNPLDAFIYFTLIAAGVYVLSKRRIQLFEVIRNNQWLTIFFIYCFLAIFWSDFPFIAFKRWIKILGHPIMVLILFTEPDPQEAVVRLMKRSAYVLVPMSILLIKYYPDVGRGFDTWTGAPMNNGVNASKNELGWMCMILGFFFFWHLLQTFKKEKSRARRNELWLIGGFLFMIWWLLSKADSATSLMSLLIGVLVVALLGLRSVNKRLIDLYVISTIIALVGAQLTIGIFDHVVALTGHTTTLAGRGELWNELLALDTNPILGVGFESFWLGDRLKALWRLHWWEPNEAHNGYLETYLNLGLVGLFLLLGLIIATYRKACLDLLRNFQWGRFRLGFLVVVVVANWTEVSFRGLSPIWFVFYIIAMDYPKPLFSSVEGPSESLAPESEMELASFDDTRLY